MESIVGNVDVDVERAVSHVGIWGVYLSEK